MFLWENGRKKPYRIEGKIKNVLVFTIKHGINNMKNPIFDETKRTDEGYKSE